MTTATDGHVTRRAFERCPAALEITAVSKNFTRGREVVHALRSVDMRVERGEFVALMGKSGAGKSTLLNVAAGFVRPDAGEIVVAGHPIGGASRRQLAAIRRRKMGFVFQFFNLLGGLTVAENVALPLVLDGQRVAADDVRVLQRLEQVGMKGEARAVPSELSGGQMQRVAIARALIADAMLVLADEPTGNLDSSTGQAVLELLLAEARSRQAGLLIVTHDDALARRADRVLVVEDGAIA